MEEVRQGGVARHKKEWGQAAASCNHTVVWAYGQRRSRGTCLMRQAAAMRKNDLTEKGGGVCVCGGKM